MTGPRGWLVYDENGNGDGIGSRFFTIQIPGQMSAKKQPDGSSAIEAANAGGKFLANTNFLIRHGFNLNAPFVPISTDKVGRAIISSVGWDRIEARLPVSKAAGMYSACLFVGEKCQALPVGASFNAKGGTFCWHVGDVFKGDFDIGLLTPDLRLLRLRVSVRR